MSVSGIWFVVLLLSSAVLIITYQLGNKKNLRMMKELSLMLERALRPSDKEYTLLGGVLGFSATYKIKGFRDVKASLFLLPRQSLLYLPIAILRTGYDSLEILFYLNKPVNEEAHVVRPTKLSHWMPKIKRKDELQGKEMVLQGEKFELLFDKKGKAVSMAKRLAEVLAPCGSTHIAITPANSVVYLRFKASADRTKMIEKRLKTAVRLLALEQ